MITRTHIALLAITTVLAAPASAQLVTEPLSDDQYHVVEVDQGVLRIDRQSGEVTECSSGENGWICRLSADDRQAYEAEITRLDGEVERLAEELDAAQTQLDALAAMPQAAVPQAGEDGLADDTLSDADRESIRERLNLPTDEELDVVMDTAEEAMRRFFAMVRDMRDEMERERAERNAL